MQNENKIRLRDRREPGHLWADNEIFDVFGDELGASGIALYMTLARLCYGSSVKVSLRGLEEYSRLGKDSVRRAMDVLVRLGLVIEVKSEKARVASTYSLTNVKELARKYVSQAVRQTVSGGDSLEVENKCESLGTAREMTYFEAYTGQAPNCLTQRQFVIEEENQEIPEPLSHPETELSQKQPKLSHQKDTFNKTQDTRKELLPPTPFQGDAREDVSEEVLEDWRGEWEIVNRVRQREKRAPLGWEEFYLDAKAEWDRRNPPKPAPDAEFAKCSTARDAASLVMRRCNLIGERLAVALAAAIGMASNGPEFGSVGEAGELAWKNYTSYQREAGTMRYTWGPKKFFAEGHWLTPNSWPREKQRSRL